MQCIDIVNRAIKLKDYRLHRGKIYSKVPESKYSFINCCSIGAFLDTLVANPNFTDVLAPNLKRLEELLSRSTCQLINQIEIDYNLINGVCFSIAEKEFVTSPISYSEIGKVTPRAYVSYSYEPSRVPLPKPFIDSLENSFPGADIRRNFLRKYYQLLLHKKFPTKTKKLCVTGETDSGKSSWFSPFMGIIPTDCIAGVTREKQFAGHLINENREVVFMDEWSIDSLNAEDAKTVLQGGLLMLPRKHKEAEKFTYNSGFYITTYQMPNFEQGHDDRAIKRKLSVFETVPIPNPRNRVSDWLRKNCMMVFHYCAKQLKDEPLFSEDEVMNDDDVGNEGYDSDEGAKYNNYDSQPSKLLRTDALKSLSFCKSDTDFTHGDAVEASIVPEDMLEKVSLNPRKVDEKPWTLCEGDINSEEYHEKVLLIALGKWRKMDLDAEDAERFDRRRRNNWSGVDSVYDAYLLCGEDPRDQFDYDLFLKRYPGWPKAWEHLYGPNGVFKEQSDCSDEVDCSKESESEEIVSERLKSSQVQRSPGKKANRRKRIKK